MITNEIQIKNAIVIEDIIGSFVNLKRHGNNYTGLCPFHNERTPSFNVHPSKGIFKCFGCGKSGDAIAFLMQHEKFSYQESLEWIAKRYNIQVTTDKPNYTPPVPRLEKLPAKYIQWFEKRGISNNTLLRKNITTSKEWMPIADKTTDVICFNYYRGENLINIKFRGAGKDFKLHKASEVLFYNLPGIEDETEAIIVEGEIDALACHEAGIYNTIALPGAEMASRVNYDDVNHIKKFILFCDNDEPGQRATEELAIRLGKFKCWVVRHPEGCKDANDVLIKHGSEFLKNLINSAVPLLDQPEATGSFPLEVFGEDIASSFLQLSENYSIPVDYLGSAAIYTIAALSGKMYKAEVPITNVIYSLLLGPSGVGKSPSYNILCGDIVQDLEQQLFDNWKRSLMEWEDAREEAKQKKQKFITPKPHRRTRTAKGGTMEGIMHHAMYSPAGFGLYYDEGGKMLGSPNQFKTDNSSFDFWNELWNGKYFNELRADADKERFAAGTCVSVLAGMQTDRLKNYFTKDISDSGLTFRFLFTSANYLKLNEQVDHFAESRKPCQDWQNLVRWLFRKGAYDYFKDDHQITVPFTVEAKEQYNLMSSQLIEASNELREARKTGDPDEMLLMYHGKLYAYFGRFALILAISRKPEAPVIDIQCLHDAMKLYLYYHDQAYSIFKKLTQAAATDLSDNEQQLLDALPDRAFTTEDIQRAQSQLKLSDRFFETAYRKKYKAGWVRRLEKGKYIKEI